MVAVEAADLFLPGFDKDEVAAKAAQDAATLAVIMDTLAGPDRRQRQHASRVVFALATQAPDVLRPYADALADALERPEPQTRWEILDTLEKLVSTDARIIDKALTGVTTSLHDVDSGVVRLAAFRVLCSYGATTARRSEKVWPLIDDAIRVYHGDPEFQNMLLGVTRLVTGAASDDVKRAAAERMEFDAEHTKGIIGRRAKKIVESAPKKSARKK
jgi:hypothetical protein